MRITTDSRSNQLITLLACLLLFMGIGRIFSLVTHNPVLGYANNYDMIRLQACHQIWPSDRIVNITAGTPAAPLRRYTLDKHVDTPCFPSSELLFTSIGIEAGKLKNLVTGEVLISIKTIGLVKAIFLAMTAMLISLYFYKRKMYAALLANGLIVGIALSDPGITLYLNTFYTEFSAVYFFVSGLVRHHCSCSRALAYCQLDPSTTRLAWFRVIQTPAHAVGSMYWHIAGRIFCDPARMENCTCTFVMRFYANTSAGKWAF